MLLSAELVADLACERVELLVDLATVEKVTSASSSSHLGTSISPMGSSGVSCGLLDMSEFLSMQELARASSGLKPDAAVRVRTTRAVVACNQSRGGHPDLSDR